MTVFLWILQTLLALALFAAGGGKLAKPYAQTAEAMPWARSFSAGQVKAIAALEVLAGLGLVLPAATGIATVLTPLAATGAALIMLGAVVTHVRLKEWSQITPGAVLLVVAVVIAWGRFGPYAW
ncbi:DoxX family protein [Streptomyces sp. VRA16 Mangrove soil]|uniref:DoxX family protein n=1 Tax=Streptomyces sp. VRA16 Mangrove soil TaxID=2817434 RepID=UPI001A9FD132|nr:DoxX family protein [Streptomyces sp. VRA16 Mangrove soil]MBO1337209.1 DoxX family protein [Streptomyces sp. VRA16 Mangrove soil]